MHSMAAALWPMSSKMEADSVTGITYFSQRNAAKRGSI
jgi:hypothetical protein